MGTDTGELRRQLIKNHPLSPNPPVKSNFGSAKHLLGGGLDCCSFSHLSDDPDVLSSIVVGELGQVGFFFRLGTSCEGVPPPPTD